MTKAGEIHLGDYVLCEMEFEGPKWVRVDKFHDDMVEATGVLPEVEDHEFDGPALSGEVICDLDVGFAVPVYCMDMCFPLRSVCAVRRFA